MWVEDARSPASWRSRASGPNRENQYAVCRFVDSTTAPLLRRAGHWPLGCACRGRAGAAVVAGHGQPGGPPGVAVGAARVDPSAGRVDSDQSRPPERAFRPDPAAGDLLFAGYVG